MEGLTHNVAILTAGGAGLRMGGNVRKQFLTLAGIPIIIRSLAALSAFAPIHQIILAVPQDEMDNIPHLLTEYGFSDRQIIVCAGGKERQDSVYNALQLCPQDTDFVFVHDAVRPFVTGSLLEQLLDAVRQYDAVIPVAKVKHTVKELDGGFVKATVPRDGLVNVFTPQAFRFALLRDCYAKAQAEGFYGTDDASLLEHFGFPVFTVESSELNIKITDRHDLLLAELIISKNLI